MAKHNFTHKTDISELNEFFFIENNEIFWKKSPSYKIKAGQKAGCVHKDGYKRVTLKRRTYTEHRIIYLMNHGVLPDAIDHIDGDKTNNNITNLRPSTLSQNQANRKAGKNNSSGRKGVVWNKKTGKWQAQIKAHGKYNYLGSFESIDVAAHEYNKAAVKHYGEFAVLNPVSGFF